jgi:hypothetical protein
MKVPVLIRNIQLVDEVQAVSQSTQVVIPSLVRLQPLNRCDVASREVFDGIGITDAPDLPLASATVVDPASVVDRERGHVDNLRRNIAPVVPEVELVGEVVQGRPQVVEAVPDDQRPVRMDRVNLTDAQAILEAFSLCFDGNGVRLLISAPEEYVYQYVEMSHSTLDFGEWVF